MEFGNGNVTKVEMCWMNCGDTFWHKSFYFSITVILLGSNAALRFSVYFTGLILKENISTDIQLYY